MCNIDNNLEHALPITNEEGHVHRGEMVIIGPDILIDIHQMVFAAHHPSSLAELQRARAASSRTTTAHDDLIEGIFGIARDDKRDDRGIGDLCALNAKGPHPPANHCIRSSLHPAGSNWVRDTAIADVID